MFIAANANMMIWVMTFIGNISNEYSTEYLRSSFKFFDENFLPLDQLPAFSVSNNPITQKPATKNMKQIGIQTISTIFVVG